MNCYEHCKPHNCRCALSVDEILRNRQQEATRVLAAFRSECERLEREYEQHGQPFGPNGLDTWLEFGGESGVNAYSGALKPPIPFH